jgi:hypothetical protein
MLDMVDVVILPRAATLSASRNFADWEAIAASEPGSIA